MTPIRIQRSRQHKQTIPAIYVGRPTIYGNPFKIVADMIYGDASHRRTILDPWIFIDPEDNKFTDWSKPLEQVIIHLYKNWLAGYDTNCIKPVPAIDWNHLRGKNLSCWCSMGKPCHADVLLYIANTPVH